jgi:hypothetical protein
MALTNDYGSYSGNTLIGELGSRGNVPNSGFGGVKGVPYPSITFIVEIDGQKYASSQWLSQQRSNPYKSQSTVAGAGLKFSLNDAIDVGVDNQGQTLEDQETYAEVSVTKNLKSVDDVLKHIAWLVDENIDALRTVTDYGNWEWKYDTSPGREATTITDPVGNTYPIGITYTGYSSDVAGGFVGKYNADSDYRAIRPGLQFEQGPFDGTKEGAEALTPVQQVKSDVVKPVKDKDTNTLTDTVGIVNPNTPIVVDSQGGQFTGTNQNFLLGDAINNTGNSSVISTILQLEKEGGLAQAGLAFYNDDYRGMPLGEMYDV